MFYHLLLIHLYRPFLKYNRSTSPLPQHVSPRRLCTQAASSISKLLRVYKRAYSFSQICNVAVYIAHTACTIHLLNLPEKNAERDLIHGLLNLEEIGESWLCARRTLRILDISANKWQVPLPQEASTTFERTHVRWGMWGSWDQPTSPSTNSEEYPSESASQRTGTPSSGLSPAGLHTTSAQQNTTSTQIAPTATAKATVTSMPQFQPETIASPASVSGMPPTHGSVSYQLQKLDSNILPEPTYLKPVTNMYQPIQAVPFTQHDAWYNTTDSHLNTASNSNSNSSPSTTASPFSNPTNLVEESQGWWSRNPNAIGFGMDNLAGGWGTGIPGGTSAAAAASTTLQGAAGIGSSSSSSEPLGFPVGMPHPGTAESEQDPSTIVYNHMGFPSGFPP